jgi:hypothetical protein
MNKVRHVNIQDSMLWRDSAVSLVSEFGIMRYYEWINTIVRPKGEAERKVDA